MNAWMLNDDGEVKIIVVNIVGEEFLLEFDNLLLTCINTKEVEFEQFFLEDFNGFQFQKKIIQLQSLLLCSII